MAMTTQCDRCQALNCQLTQLLGVEVCGACVDEAKVFLRVAPNRSGGGLRNVRAARIMQIAQSRGRVSAATVATVTGEPYRHVYYSCFALVKSGYLVHAGRGIFVLPAESAA